MNWLIVGAPGVEHVSSAKQTFGGVAQLDGRQSTVTVTCRVAVTPAALVAVSVKIVVTVGVTPRLPLALTVPTL